MWRIELADRDVKAERKVVNAWAKKNKKELEGDKKMQAEYAEMLARVDSKVLETVAALLRAAVMCVSYFQDLRPRHTHARDCWQVKRRGKSRGEVGAELTKELKKANKLVKATKKQLKAAKKNA